MITNIKLVSLLFIVAVGPLGCSLFSNKAGDAELVFAATEVGTPEGDKVTKDIGPAGGTLSSPDGRMMLTVPQGALTETLPFSIQPITNKADGGLGLAYRLEPDGSTFTTPLQISVRYDEKHLEGTVPDALSIAYQDKQGAWHAQTTAKLDQAAKTLTYSTTHFTDVAVFPRLRILPPKATVYVGKELQIRMVVCRERGFLDRLLSRPVLCSPLPERGKWTLSGPGRLDFESFLQGVNYQAPLKKPTPNRAEVNLTGVFQVWNPVSGETTKEEHTFTSKITIIDRGYRAAGKTADLSYSGTICDLEKPFTVNGSVIGYKFNFTPSSATGGKVTITAAGMMVTAEGGGSYTIEGIDSDKPRIAVNASVAGHSPVGSKTGSGTIYIDLIPLTDECK